MEGGENENGSKVHGRWRSVANASVVSTIDRWREYITLFQGIVLMVLKSSIT
jgi:hypothetical protein